MFDQRESASDTLRDGHPSPSSGSPARRALANHLAAVATAAAEVDRLRGPARRLAEAATAEADAQAALDQIAADEAAEMSEWAETGSGEMPQPHTAARRKAGEKLAAAKAQANAARSAGNDIAERLGDASRRHAALATRTQGCVNDVLIEAAADIVAAVNRSIAEASAQMSRFAALSELIHRQQHPDDPSTFAPGAALRAMQPPLPVVEVLLGNTPHAAIDQHVARWRQLADRLARDPNASL